MEAALKQRVYTLIDKLPAESTLEDLLSELHELQLLEKALASRAAGRLVPHEEAKARLMSVFRKDT